jgi:hypothetical protein
LLDERRAELEAGVGGGGDGHDAAPEARHHLAVARVGGVGEDHFVARVGGRRDHQQQRRGGAGGDDDARRVDVHVMAVAVEVGDRRAQCGEAERVRVRQRPAVHHLAHRVAHGRRRAEVRLADAELDDPVPVRLQGGGALAEDQRVERLDGLGAVGELHRCGAR